MSMVGTFDGFTAARLGIYAAQHGLRVTGNNVSNINTTGYTRQRVDQYSFKAGANDMYRSLYDNHVGSGALVQGINQVRDPYLDIRYRNASTDTYHYDTWLSGLQNIASILDEVGKGENQDGLIYRAIQDLAEKLRSYSANPTELNDRLVRNSATSLTLLFHNAANQLEKLYNETAIEFNEDVSAVNEILTNIRDLNKSIRESEIHGDHALEMRDERNRQIDALSQYLDIKVEYSYETVGGGIEVEKLTIKLNDANPDNSVHTDESILVDGVFATQLSVPEEKPAFNMYDKDSDYAYLNKYLYTREVSADDHKAIDAFLKANPNLTMADLEKTKTTDKNGSVFYLIGTNDPDLKGVIKETNDNFTIQLGKLLNIKGEEWKKTTTAWTELTGSDKLPELARYVYNITIDKAQANTDGNLTFKIDGDDKTYEVSADLSEAEILAYVAQQLNGAAKYKDYNVTASADGKQLIFTEKKPGEVATDDNGKPVDPPKLSITPPTGTWITTTGDLEFTNGSLPADAGTVETDGHGNVTKSIDYVLAGGKWYKLTISTDYTHEVTLDDNDLHGILQAQREMLTEEGEFASTKDVAIDESALTKRGIPYYIKSLDLLAQKFAKAYNQLNSGYAYNQEGVYIKKDGTEVTLHDLDRPIKDDNENIIGYEALPVTVDGKLTDGQIQYLINNGYFRMNELGQPIDEAGNLITDENGQSIGYFRANKEGLAIDKYGNVIKDEKGNSILASKLTFDDDGKPQIVTGDDVPVPLDDKIFSQFEADLNSWLDEFGYPMGGDLFTALDGTTTEGITAKNISISHGWSNGLWNLVPTFKMLFTDSGSLTHSTQNDNADHMVAMIDKALTYNPRDLDGSDAIGPELFNGSFNDMLSNMMAVQAVDADITNVRLSTAAGILNEVDYSREGVSGVDLNDEAMNMVTYQKAMTAAMRVMTAIDEVLDRLINNTGIAGR